MDRTESCGGEFAALIGKLTCGNSTEKPLCAELMCHHCYRRGPEVGVALLRAGLLRCVHLPGLLLRWSRVAKYLSSRSRLLAPSVRYCLTIKSCHSILGVFLSCPGSAGCSKVEIKANLLLWLWKTSVTSALILSEEIRDAPAPWSGDGGQAPLSAALL